MKFGIVSCEGTSLSFAARLVDEGEDVLVYHMPGKPTETPPFRNVGRGIVPITTTWAEFSAHVTDGGIAIFDGSGHGKKADALRLIGVPVVGAGSFCDKLEGDREYGFKIALECGMALPKYHAFSSVTETIAWVAKRPADEEWFFKTDRYLDASATAGGNRERLTAKLTYIRTKYGDRITHILQEKIKGIAISTAGYWNGFAFLRPWEGTLERKEVGNGDVGPKTGCSMNVVWFYPDETKIIGELGFEKLAEIFRKEQAPAGIYDINAQLSFDDGKAYFLEFTPRYGYDAEPTAQRLLTMPYGEFIARLSECTLPMIPFDLNHAAFSIRLSVPPYPYEIDAGLIPEKKTPVGLPLLGLDGMWGEKLRDRFIAYGVMEDAGQHVLADPSGLVGLSSAVGTDLTKMNDAAVKYAKSLGIADLNYRTDSDKALTDDLKAVRKAGFPAPLIDAGREQAN